MNKQTGQIALLLLLVVVLTAGLWGFMRWNNHQAIESLNDNILRLDSSIERKNQLIEQLEGDKKQLIAELATQKNRSTVEATRFLGEQQALRLELTDMTQQLNTRVSQLSETSALLAGKEATVANLQEQLIEKSSGIDSLLEEKQILTSDIEAMTVKLATGNDEVTALAQERDSIAEQVQSLEQQLTELNQYSEQLSQRYTQVNRQLESEIERSEEYSQKIETLEEQNAREQAALRALEQQINQFRADNESLQEVNSSLLDNNQQLDGEKRQLIQQYENGISVIRLPNRILFDTGSAQLNAQGAETLALVARTLKEFPDHLISVEGHTDHRPIGSVLARRYPSNWELSSARAASAIRVLVGEDIPSTQFQVVGFADTRPLVDKTQTQLLGKNRRIEILLFPPVERKQKVISLNK